MNYQHFTLKNGLQAVLVPIQEMGSATTMVMVGAGSRYEEAKNNGISHFLEHMAFKGTKKRPTALEIATIIDGIGAESNAFTGKEITGYYIKSESSHIGLSLDILSDMLANLKLDSEEINKERGVILEELNLYEDTPTRKIYDIFEDLLYGDTPMGWDIGGKKDVINKITRSDFVSYMKKLYSASNMVVVVAGKMNIKDTKHEIEERFGALPTFTTSGYKSVIEGQKGPQVLVRHKTTEQAHFALGVRTIGMNDEKDKYPLDILAAILGGGMSSRLFSEIREKGGLSYYVRTNSEHYLDAGYFTSYIGADPKRIDEAIKVTQEEYEKVQKKGEVTEKEVNKAKEYVKGHFVLDLEDTRSVAVHYASSLILEKKLENPEEILKKIDKVTLSDVVGVAKKYLKPEVLNLAIIGNFESDTKFKKLLA